MFSAILSFLGGSFVRMIWGEVSSWIDKAREHKREVERMKVQAELEAAQHARNLEAIKVQAELGVQTIRVQGEMDTAKLEAEGWAKSVEQGQKPTGIYVIDFWNGIIRPAAATFALWLWYHSVQLQSWTMQGRDWDMVCAILGWFFADRSMGKRGK